MATEEWKKEVQRHEEYIKNLEDKYKKKCLAVEVLGTLLSETLKCPYHQIVFFLSDSICHPINFCERKMQFG